MLGTTEVALNVDEIPADVMEALSKLDKVKEAQTSVALTMADLSVISQGLGLFQSMVKHGLRAGRDVPDSMLDMLTDAKVLERRIDSVAKDVMVRELGPDFDMDAMMIKVSELAEKVAGGSKAEDGPGFGFGNTTYL